MTPVTLRSRCRPAVPRLQPLTGVYSLAQEQEPRGAWEKTKAWAWRHPALSGAITGGLAGTTVFPGVGTFIGAVTGAVVGSTVGADERAREEYERKRAKDDETPPYRSGSPSRPNSWGCRGA